MLLEWIYPNVCVFCDKILEKNWICNSCRAGLPYFSYSIERLNLKERIFFDKLLCVFQYKGKVKQALHLFKFKGQKYIYHGLVEELIRKLIDSKIEFDVVIPVPIHLRRYMERGYNQSFLLAKEIGKYFQKKILKRVLVKKLHTRPQSVLTHEERRRSVMHAFEIRRPQFIKNKVVLLIDDVYTTGATVNECSKVLKKGGAKEIIVLTVARS